jgi:dTDP-4-amino-4,6-dideoxygalactose transaminase
MRVEFGELRIGEVAKQNLLHCCDTNWASGGPKVKEFEDKWGNLFGYAHNKAVSSGTDACIAAVASLYDLGAQRGDEVIVPALSFIATSNAVLAAGLTPVFVDVERHTLNINPKLIEAAITPKTRAIMVVHTMGKPCEMDTICDIAKQHNLIVIEDSCEAHGAKYKDKFIGTWGDAACFSFYVAHLICCGEGGMVSTMRQDIADSVNSVRTHGRKNGDLYFNHERFGLNCKMNDLEASLGLEAVDEFWWVFNTRKKNLYYLIDKFKEAGIDQHAWINEERENEIHCPHAFTITVKDPVRHPQKELYAYLEENSIKCKRNFGCIPTQHEAFAWMGHKLGDFPAAEYIGEHGLHFGCHQFLTQADLDYIVEKVVAWFTQKGI